MYKGAKKTNLEWRKEDRDVKSQPKEQKIKVKNIEINQQSQQGIQEAEA